MNITALYFYFASPLIPLLELDLDREMHRPPGVVDSSVLLGHDVVNHRLKHMSFTDIILDLVKRYIYKYLLDTWLFLFFTFL